jgi:hypothetical protein
VPYGADEAKFFPPGPGEARAPSRIVYAGQLSLRKGLRLAFTALEKVRALAPLELHLYGSVNRDMESTLAQVAGLTGLQLHAPVTQTSRRGRRRSAWWSSKPSTADCPAS